MANALMALQVKPVDVASSYGTGLQAGRQNRLMRMREQQMGEESRRAEAADQRDAKRFEMQTETHQGRQKAQGLDLLAKQIAVTGQLLRGVQGAQNPAAAYAKARQIAGGMGMDLSQVPEQYDPEYVDTALRIVGEQAQEVYRLLEGGEATSAGYRPGAVVQVGPDGKQQVLQQGREPEPPAEEKPGYTTLTDADAVALGLAPGGLYQRAPDGRVVIVKQPPEPEPEPEPRRRTLTAEEMQELNLPEGGVFQTDDAGQIYKIYTPPRAEAQLPDGYRMRPDGTAEPIPGTEAATKQQDRARSEASAEAALQRGIETVRALATHPGLDAAVGKSSMLPTMRGSDAAGFEARLNGFKAQAFLQEIERMKGTGAITDTEGQALATSVGALDLSMPEYDFRRSLAEIEKYLTDKLAAQSGTPGSGAGRLSVEALIKLYGD